MRLVPERKNKKNKNKKRYDTLTIFLYDGEVFTYDMKDWVVYREPDWVELVRIDETEMHSYTVGNIIRVMFSKIPESKNISIVRDSGTKPTPPTAA